MEQRNLFKFNGTKIAESEDFQFTKFPWESIAANCSTCGLRLSIPYIKGSEKYHFVQTYPCSKCGGKIKFDTLIKTMLKVGCRF